MPDPESSPRGRFVLTPEQRTRAGKAFAQALDNSALAYEVGQLGLFHEEDETFIRREVERMLYEQKLPNGGDKERKMIKRLEEMAADNAKTSWAHLGRCQHAISEWKKVLPADPRNAGRYYTRRKLTMKEDKDFFKEMFTLEESAGLSKDWKKKWFARMMLDGLPEAVSDFKMECLFLLRKTDGSVTRLIRLRNNVGEISRGDQHDGSVVLDEHAFASAERFREWCLRWGNFLWSGNMTALHFLLEDINRASSWKVINQVDSVGWREVQSPKSKAQSPAPGGTRPGIWFFGDCAYADGQPLTMNEDGIYSWQGEGYYLNRRGREANFEQGKPKLNPDWRLAKIEPVEGAAAGWQLVRGRTVDEAADLRSLFRDLCVRFYDTLGSYEGWLGMGAMFAYAAAPELFHRFGNFPGLWVHGQMGSGKTTYMEWLMHLWGFNMPAGIGLRTGTAVGIQSQCENYSNLPLWLDQYAQGKVKEDKEGVMEDAYNRQPSVKWAKDGIMREMKTMFAVSGESTPSVPALQSRYAFAQVSRAKRLNDHLLWMQANKPVFFVFCRFLLEHRADFVELLQNQLDAWLHIPRMAGMSERDKATNGIPVAAWSAMCGLLESHGAEEVKAFKDFMVEHTKSSSADVTRDTNVNAFVRDMVTAYNAGAIPETCFRVEYDYAPFPPDHPNQATGWKSYRLYIDPEQTISAINIHLRKAGTALALRTRDLRSQLSKTDYWIPLPLRKSFGAAGRTVNMACWGFELDKLGEMGRQDCSDEEHQEWLLHAEEADPRKGPIYAIVAGVEASANKLIEEVR